MRTPSRVPAWVIGSAAWAGGIYLDGDWQSLMDGLRARAVAAGVDIRARVEAVARWGQLAPWRRARPVGRTPGPCRVWPCHRTAVALLAPVSDAAREWAVHCVPVRAACLDIALSHLP